jgi:cysteine desulfurase
MGAYLDHAATSPLRPEAFDAMVPFLTEHFGNPSGSHSVARTARRAVDDARDALASALGCRPGELVFTAGGTEADNLAVLGVAGAGPGDVVTSAVEHHAVLHAARAVGGVIVPVDSDGVVDLGALAEALHPGTALVSVMLANNEVGTIEPLGAVIDLVRARAPGARVHTDAVAAAAHLDLSSLAADADLVSVSAHKFGGPKGVGALVVRGTTRLSPVLHGGGQERDRRPGTHDVAGIVGMAAALGAAAAEREDEARRLRALTDRLVDAVVDAIDGVSENGPSRRGEDPAALRLPGVANIAVAGVDSEELLLLLDEAGIQASAGAACASGAATPSHVLVAMGRSSGQARCALRFSLGHASTEADVDRVVAVMPDAVQRLRSQP